MKAKILVAAVASALVSGAAFAEGEPAQALLQWTGYVTGVFNTSEIALTGQGGGAIQAGLLKIAEDGTFSSERAVTVEAHASEVDDAGTPLEPSDDTYEAADAAYSGDVAWSLTGVAVSNSAYDLNQLTFQLNGTDVAPEGTAGGVDESLTTDAGSSHVVGVTVSYAEPVTDVAVGDSVQVSATILATPSVGSDV
ncbi:MAG: hypothetical protein ACK5NL_04610 [Vibrio fluvialis]